MNYKFSFLFFIESKGSSISMLNEIKGLDEEACFHSFDCLVKHGVTSERGLDSETWCTFENSPNTRMKFTFREWSIHAKLKCYEEIKKKKLG